MRIWAVAGRAAGSRREAGVIGPPSPPRSPRAAHATRGWQGDTRRRGRTSAQRLARSESRGWGVSRQAEGSLSTLPANGPLARLVGLAARFPASDVPPEAHQLGLSVRGAAEVP